MSHYSQHCLSKDFDKMKPIIIIIDCLVQSVPLGGIHTWAHILKYTQKDLRLYHLLPLQTHGQSRPRLLKKYIVALYKTFLPSLMPVHVSSFPRRFRHGRAVTDQGRLLQLPGCPTGAESTSRRWCGGEVLCQLIRGAELLLAKRGEKVPIMLSETCHSVSLFFLSTFDVTSLFFCPTSCSVSFSLGFFHAFL